MIAGSPPDTIFASSSGMPPSAIAVVRVSGPAASAMLVALAGRLPVPRMATLAALRTADGALLDRALLLWFPGPASATGEDLAELHIHGGRAVIEAVLGALALLPGLRAAEPGEFTRRAFAAGRIDLLEAEGLADLLAAETESERRRALHAAEGGISRLVGQWRAQLLGLAARTEALLEFGEDDPDAVADPALPRDLAALAAELANARDRPPAERLRDGVRVVLCGPPNAGKSSLINALADRDVAIATPHAGTTRDLIEAPLTLSGVPIVLVDSAGLRDGGDPVEQAGVARAEQAIATADLLLWLGMPESCPDLVRSLVIHPRADLPGREQAPAGCDVAVSVVSSDGLAELRALLLVRARGLLPARDAPSFPARQRALVEQMARQVAQAAAEADPLLQAEHLRSARESVDRLLGRAGVEEMLDALFGRFCIGK